MIEAFVQIATDTAQFACEKCPSSSDVCLKELVKVALCGETENRNAAVRALVETMRRSGSLVGVVSCGADGCTHSDRIGAHHLVIDAQ